MRTRRAGLDREFAEAAGIAVATRLASLPAVAAASRVAAYRAVRGEIVLDEIVDGERWEAFTLPRVVGEHLEFVARFDGQSFASGSFGISEPLDGEVVPFADHDVVLVPVVAFDARCHRLGQGGGFYDRAVASLAGTASRSVGLDAAGSRVTAAPPRPVMIGVAHWFQQVESVPCERWDLPLDAIVTDRDVVAVDRRVLD